MNAHGHRSVSRSNAGSVRRACTHVEPLKLTVLCASICAVLGGSGAALAQEATEEIVITGSRIIRRDLAAPSPILTVDTEAFEQSSNVSLEAVLNQYPQFKADDTQFVASDIQPTANNSPGASTLNLRGLGASRSLVLLDGRRAQPVNAALTVDINTLPAAAISRVEVISGGAAATYGPDAMAGVVNFILKDDFEGVSVNYQPVGRTRATVKKAGSTLDRRQLWRRPRQRHGRHRLRRARSCVRANARFLRGPHGRQWHGRELHPHGLAELQPGRDCPAVAGGCQLGDAGGGEHVAHGCVLVNPATGSAFRTTNALASGYDGSTTAPYLIREHNGTLEQNNPRGWLSSPLERRMIFGRATYDLTDTMSVFAQGLFNKSDVDQLLAPTPLANGANVQRNPALEPAELRILLDSRQADPDGTVRFRRERRAPQRISRTTSLERFTGGRTAARPTTEVNELVFGVEGELGSDWTWEAYYQDGSTTMETRMTDFVWEDRYRALAAQPNFGRGGSITVAAANENTVTRTMTCTSGLPLLEPWVWGPNYEVIYPSGFELSQDCVDAITVDMLQSNVVEQHVHEANFQGKLADLRAGELRSAFGISNRVNYSLFEPDPLYIATEQAEGERKSAKSTARFSTRVRRFRARVRRTSLGFRDRRLELRREVVQGAVQLGRIGFVALPRRLAARQPRAERRRALRGCDEPGVRLGRNGRRVHGQHVASVGQHRRQSEPRGGSRSVPATHLSVGRHSGSERLRHPRRQQLPERRASVAAQLSPDHGGQPASGAREADTLTLGFVWQLQGPDLSFSVDWYEIEIDNVIGSLGFLSAYEQCFNANGRSNPTFSIDNEYCQRITRDPVNAEPLLVYGGNFNLSERFTSGVDFTVQWTKDMAGGPSASVRRPTGSTRGNNPCYRSPMRRCSSTPATARTSSYGCSPR